MAKRAKEHTNDSATAATAVCAVADTSHRRKQQEIRDKKKKVKHKNDGERKKWKIKVEGSRIYVKWLKKCTHNMWLAPYVSFDEFDDDDDGNGDGCLKYVN